MSEYLVFPPGEDMYQADQANPTTLVKGTYCYSLYTFTWYVLDSYKDQRRWVVVPKISVPNKYRTLSLLLT